MMSSSHNSPVIFWFRRDLRLQDNTGLYHALLHGHPVLPIFIFDTHILDTLNNDTDRRVLFIYQEIQRLKAELKLNFGTTLRVFHGKPESIAKTLILEYGPVAVFANEDYEPYARVRDTEMERIFGDAGVAFYLYKDHVLFARDEIVKADGNPYTMFTPYSKQWLSAYHASDIETFDVASVAQNFVKCESAAIPSLEDLGFRMHGSLRFPERHANDDLLRGYSAMRNIPAADATSHLGVHLRYGTISVRALATQACRTSPVFLNELIWREFFQQILWHFPQVVDSSFKSQYDDIVWRNDASEFAVWCSGMTGYPMVDAGMRELNATGFMHNRIRMVVASFLTKHLLIDWRWGEAWFAEKLLDYELASNNGNWQWAAGTGCDAAPYFRIFNPEEQARKFDPDGKYQRKWIPELGTSGYPLPMVDHKMARIRALRTYKEALHLRA